MRFWLSLECTKEKRAFLFATCVFSNLQSFERPTFYTWAVQHAAAPFDTGKSFALQNGLTIVVYFAADKISIKRSSEVLSSSTLNHFQTLSCPSSLQASNYEN